MSSDDPRPVVFQMLDSTAPNQRLVETVSFKVARTKVERFLELAGGLLTDSRRNPGSISFELHELLFPPGEEYVEYLLYEIWRDRDSLRPQWESDFLRVFQSELVSQALLVSPPELKFYRH
jgi:quinol monooxygenase YgiN